MYNNINLKQLVGLLWADQNLLFGETNGRLLEPEERKNLWYLLKKVPQPLREQQPYFFKLSIKKAIEDNIQFTKGD